MCSHDGRIASAPDGSVRSLESLEREITELASHIHAATCRWLLLVAEYDAREGWAPWGCRSCAHWVSWRCGVAPVAAREHVRVARRLRDLPLIREAFAAGQLSYSKVRALTRVENVEREQELLDLARHATAAQLERLVRAYRGVVAVERAAADEEPPERWLSWSYDDHGCLLLRGRLPAEEGALVVAALEAAREAARNTVRDRAGDEPGASAEAPDRGADRVRSASAEASDHDAGPIRPASTGPPARGGGGTGPASAEALDEDAGAIRPASAEAADRGGGGTRPASAEALEEGPPVTARRLELTAGEARADALLAMAETLLAGGAAARSGGDRYQVVVHVDAPTLGGAERGERCELEDGAPLAAETARRLACDAALVPLIERAGKPLDVGRKTRTIPPGMRRALASRDGGCRFPGCGARHHLHAHHIEHWAKGGRTSLSNLVQLCGHHHRLLHEGGYSMSSSGRGELTFRRADGRRIVACPPAPRGRANALRERRPGDHPAVHPDACASLSAGEPMDLDLGVDALLAFAPPSTEPPGI